MFFILSYNPILLSCSPNLKLGMELINVEFKARISDFEKVKQLLDSLSILCEGDLKQVDTYYNVPKGRVKLREYDSYSSLIYYNRENTAGVKQSDVLYYKHASDPALGAILEMQFGVKVKVSKVRRKYVQDNVSIHLDTVDGLGCFVEVEACNKGVELGLEDLRKQCDAFFELLQLRKEDLIDVSYSDLLLAQQK